MHQKWTVVTYRLTFQHFVLLEIVQAQSVLGILGERATISVQKDDQRQIFLHDGCKGGTSRRAGVRVDAARIGKLQYSLCDHLCYHLGVDTKMSRHSTEKAVGGMA